MYIKRLNIENFRGIGNMDWTLEKKLYCMIGTNDSTKTTILDAIEYVLYPYWNLNIVNSDFYNCDTTNTIKIELTIGEIPEYFMQEDTFGLYIRKFVKDLSDDEPKESDEVFLTIQLIINDSFEPEWKVITNRGMEKIISYKERAKLCISRVGENIDKDFFIGRNSILKKYINDTKELDSQLIKILQSIKEQNIDISSIKGALNKIKDVTNSYDLKLNNELGVEIELKSSDLNTSNIGISDGKVPINRKGTGSKRLLSSILNLGSNTDSSVILIDEIEYGLEPYRIADLLSKLKKSQKQVIITTHSTIPITELNYDNLIICRSCNGKTILLEFLNDFQRLLRKNPYAFLARKVIITEGATEWGCLRVFNQKWAENNLSLAYSSGIVLDGEGGAHAINKAKQFKNLGYDVAIFIDGDDKTVCKEAKELKDIKVFRLKDGYNTEKSILNDISINNIENIIKILVELKDSNYVQKCINEEFNLDTLEIQEIKKTYSEIEIKNKMYNILTKKDKKNNPIFKGNEYGCKLGELIYNLTNTNSTDFEIVLILNNIKEWCNGI